MWSRSQQNFWEEFGFEVILALIFPSANHRAESYEANASGEGQHYCKCLLRVSVPGVGAIVV